MSPRSVARGVIAVACLGKAMACEIPEGAVEMQLISAPAVSPDGKSMVFEWINDLWTASTDGGEALCVEANPAREAFPLFSPDGKRIVFSSDRTGSMQVFSIPAAGGSATQHTHQTEGNELKCLSSDGTRAIIRGTRELAGFRATGLFTINLTKDEREQRLFNVVGDAASWSPDGTRVLFSKGGGAIYRKGYKGADSSQIWQYEIATGKFESKVAEGTDARLPYWHPDGKGFFYLSGRSGTLNLMSLREGSSGPESITPDSDEIMISRNPSADGSTFVFQKGLYLFRYKPKTAAQPNQLTLWTRTKLPDISRFREEITQTTNADFTTDLDQVVFSSAGELWTKKGAEGLSVRLTDTAAAESDVVFSPDGQWLYFLRDDGLEPNYFRARLHDRALSDVQRVTCGAARKARFARSPDGKKIAWVEGTGNVFTAAADGSNPKCVFKCWDRPTFDWDPNGRWLAIAAEDKNANRDIWLGDAEGRRAPLNLTRDPAFESSPRWSPDGRWLAFSAKRGTSGLAGLWVIDFGTKTLAPDFKKLAIEHLAEKAKKIPTGEIEPIRVIWSADSKSLLFQNKKSADSNLYSIAPGGGGSVILATKRGLPIRVAKDGSLLWTVNQTPTILKDTRSVAFPISTSIERSRDEVLQIAFRSVWKALGERFYEPSMNGTHWEDLRLKYEPAAAMSRTSQQFDRVVSQLFGELNASHLAFLRKPWTNEILDIEEKETTAHPGLVFEDSQSEGPLVIKRVIRGSHVALLREPPKAGDTIVRIAGEEVTRHSPLDKFFNGGADRTLPVVIRSKDGEERVIELRCISYGQARELDRKEKEKEARRLVARSGKNAYLPVRDMSMKSFIALELAVYRKSLVSTGMILDFRNNGGGREADRMLSLFCQPVHSFTVPRGGPEGYPVARLVHALWSKPLVVLCNENTFSNAEIFCHAISETGRAPLVGVATSGGVISAVKETIADTGVLEIPFRGWFQSSNGNNLDLNGAKPDYPVDMTPADEHSGRDPQLEKAIEVLGELVEKLPEPVAPVYRK